MKFFSIFLDAFKEWQNDKATVWGAALSYFTVFSLSPLLLIVISLAGLFFGQAAVEGSIFRELRGFLGDDGASLLQDAVKNANKPATSIITTVIGFVTLLLGASGVFAQLKEALNAIFNVSKQSSGGIKGILFEKILTFSMVGVIGFLLLVSLIATATISGLNSYFNTLFPFPEFILEYVNFFVSFLLISGLFAVIYKVLPDTVIPWKYAFIGGTITSLLFTIGKTLIGIYLGYSSVGSTFGAAASLIIILVWVYYAAQILFYGAEVTQVIARRQGVIFTPKKGAVKLESPLGERDKERKALLQRKAKQNLQPFLAYVLAGFLVEIFSRVFKKK